MAVYSFYIFDRHAECIYKRRWLQRPVSTSSKTSRPTSEVTPPTNSSINGVSSSSGGVGGGGRSSRSADDDAKLVFGTVFSLRNMVRKLGGEDDR